MTPRELEIIRNASGVTYGLDDPWPETNSRQEPREQVLRVIHRYQKLTFAQAVAIENALDSGLEVWAVYVMPYPERGVRIEVSGDMEESLVAIGFERRDHIWDNRRYMLLPQ